MNTEHMTVEELLNYDLPVPAEKLRDFMKEYGPSAIIELENHITHLESEKDELQEEIDSLEESNAELKKQIEDLEQQVEDIEKLIR